MTSLLPSMATAAGGYEPVSTIAGQRAPDGAHVPNAPDAARKKRIQAAWAAYRGDTPRPLKVKPGKPDDNVLTNRVKPIVDVGASFLAGDDMTFTVGSGDDEESANTAAQEWLDDVWARNSAMTLITKMAMDGAVAGHVFVKIVPGDTIGLAPKVPKLVLLDPATVTVTTDPEDVSEAIGYSIEYQAPTVWNNALAKVEQITRDAGGQSWTVTRQERGPATGGQWRVTQTTPWAYPFPPICDCQNLPDPHSYYGIPDLDTDILQANADLNFILSNMNRLIRLYAHPLRWAKGLNAAQLVVDPDNITVLPAADSAMGQVEMTSNLTSSLAFAKDLRSDMDEMSGVPGVAVGRMDTLPRGQLSGITIRLLFMPLLSKTTKKRWLYGDMLRALCCRLLVLGKFARDERDYDITVHWPNPLPVDQQADAETALLLEQIGVSQTRLLTDLGYDPEEEARLRGEEAQEKLAAFAKGQGLPPVPPAPVVPLPGQPAPPVPAVPVPAIPGAGPAGGA